MTTTEERLHILRMVAAGQITAEEGDDLLAALDGSPDDKPSPPARWINIRIRDERSGRQKVNINVPVGVLSVGMRLGARLGINGMNIDDVLDRIRAGDKGKLVDVQSDNGERVEITVQ